MYFFLDFWFIHTYLVIMAEKTFARGMNAVVAIPLPLSHQFIYAIPPHLEAAMQVGIPVFVPFGRRNITGFVTGFSKETPEGIKPIKDIVDPEPCFSPQQLELFSWISRYYLSPLGQIIRASVPSRLSIRESTIAHAREDMEEKLRDNPDALVLYRELVRRPLSRSYIMRKFSTSAAAYGALLKEGIIYEEIRSTAPPSRTEKNGVKLAAPFDKEIHRTLARSAKKQAALYEFLSGKQMGVEKKELHQLFGNCTAPLRGLEEKDLISFFQIPFTLTIPHIHERGMKKPKLTASQQRAIERISEAIIDGRFETFLLYGITGSGKTEVYLRTVEKVLNKGKGAIVLVPEVSLTAQTVEVFKSRFGDTVVIYHSRLAESERIGVWRGIKKGKYRIVIGARFAIFAPVENLGALIVDEEHESTYKQRTQEPLYSARDAAVVRARIENAVCLLGSATPSVESFHNARLGKYTLLELPTRIAERELPPVEIVDMRKEEDFLLSRSLKEKMKERIRKDEQTILFINRRGFSNFILCSECGFSPRCPFCDVTLTFHKKGSLLKCHHCGYEEQAPRSCPKCKGSKFFYAGMGTQRIERALAKEFPALRVMRMDLDTMRKKWAHMESFFRFRDGEADLLLGTQMVTKGFDLPRVTLVGVISADTVLNFPDFRAQERTFQLLTQVAGRTGRGSLGGEVVVQTYAPEHYSITESRLHDYEGFFKKEIAIRRELAYPPFSRLARIVIACHEQKAAEKVSHTLSGLIKKKIKEDNAEVILLGPVACPLSRLKGYYRAHILLKATKPFRIQKLLGSIREGYSAKGARILYDIDPLDMM
jgi:primosomal protein N' (replication factor Y)